MTIDLYSHYIRMSNLIKKFILTIKNKTNNKFTTIIDTLIPEI